MDNRYDPNYVNKEESINPASSHDYNKDTSSEFTKSVDDTNFKQSNDLDNNVSKDLDTATNVKDLDPAIATSEKAKTSMADIQKKSNVVGGMFTTTAVAVTVVAATTIFGNSAADAGIVKVKGFEDSVFYHVSVYEHEEYEAGTLRLVVESQLDEYTIALEYGETYGFLPGIQGDTNFDVRLEVDSTFGTDKLGEVSTQTKGGYESVVFYPKLTNSREDELLDYTLRINSQDTFNELSSMRLETLVINPYTDETIKLPDIDLALTQNTFNLTAIPNTNTYVEMRVIGTVLETGEEVLLETETFTTPFKTTTEGRISQITNQTATYEIIPDYVYLPNLSYSVTLFDVDGELETVVVEPTQDVETVTFEKLYPNTLYGIEARYTYTNPYNEEEIEFILTQEEFVTPDRIETIYSTADLGDEFQINITAEGNIALYDQVFIETNNENIYYDLEYLDANTVFVQIAIEKLDTEYPITFGLTDKTNENRYIIQDVVIPAKGD